MIKQTSKTIMVIEDEELLLHAISKKLEFVGMETVSCTSAEQAIDYLNNLEKSPDGIWLDYHLKGMDGLEFLGILKQNTKWSTIPVLVVSNSADDAAVQNILALGANKYILKAKYRLEEIIDILKEATNKKDL